MILGVGVCTAVGKTMVMTGGKVSMPYTWISRADPGWLLRVTFSVLFFIRTIDFSSHSTCLLKSLGENSWFPFNKIVALFTRGFPSGPLWILMKYVPFGLYAENVFTASLGEPVPRTNKVSISVN